MFWEGLEGLKPPRECPGNCLGKVLGAMLEDVDSKTVFFGLSWAMLWHLGAKMAHKSAKTRENFTRTHARKSAPMRADPLWSPKRTIPERNMLHSQGIRDTPLAPRGTVADLSFCFLCLLH